MIDLGYLCVESGIILFLFRDIFSTIYFNFVLFSLYSIFTQRRFFQPKVEHWNFLQILPFFALLHKIGNNVICGKHFNVAYPYRFLLGWALILSQR